MLRCCDRASEHAFSSELEIQFRCSVLFCSVLLQRSALASRRFASLCGGGGGGGGCKSAKPVLSSIEMAAPLASASSSLAAKAASSSAWRDGRTDGGREGGREEDGVE